MRVFISHSSSDISEVRRLAHALEARGISCWFAPEEINFASDYAEQLMQGIESCDATIVVLSRASMESRHVRREIEIADGMDHKFYPVRLLDLILVQQLSYFLPSGQWIDLFEGDIKNRYDELASAIKGRRVLERRRNTRRSRVMIGVILLALAVICAAIAGFILFQDRIQDALRGEVAFEDPFPDSYLEAYRVKTASPDLSALTKLTELRFHMTGFPTQLKPVEILVLDPASRVVGQTQVIPKNNNGLVGMQAPILTDSETLSICIVFRDSTNSRFALLKKISSSSNFDAKRRVLALENDQDCITSTGAKPRTEDISQLRTAMQAAQLERQHAYALILQLLTYPREKNLYTLGFSRTGGWDGPSQLPDNVRVVLESGPDNKNWLLDEILTHGEYGRYQDAITYRRQLDQFVRLCVTTAISNEDLFVHHDRTFELTGDRTAYVSVGSKSRPFLNDNGEWCRQSRDPNKGLIAIPPKLNPIEEALPLPGPTATNVSMPRNEALRKIAEGRIAQYGYSIDGFQFGMPFNASISLAQQILPKATIRNEDRPHSLDQPELPVGAMVVFTDAQRGRSISLLQSAPNSGPARLIGVYLSYTSKKFPLTLTELRSRARRLYGTDTLKDVETQSTGVKMWWSNSRNECHYWNLYDEYALGIYSLPPKGCRRGLFLDARHYRDGRGRVGIGLYDFQALQ
ncbi:MAG: toll/interleukin-1 receptor domain-containing protein [Rhizobiaceae bacterium]